MALNIRKLFSIMKFPIDLACLAKLCIGKKKSGKKIQKVFCIIRFMEARKKSL